MDDILYNHLHRTEPHHWFYAGRRKIIFDQIRSLVPQSAFPRVLDLGCGTGYDTLYFSQNGYINIMGLDISAEALKFCQKRGITNLICGDGIILPFPDNLFDMIMALDLLEHIQDDLAALKEQIRVLKPGGVVIIFVPAYKFLRSFQDEVYHNIRRYEIDELQRKVRQAGLTVTKLTYINTFLFPLVLIGRMILRIMGRPQYVTSENDLHPAWSNIFFRYIFSSESLLLNLIDFPFGTSILCIARK